VVRATARTAARQTEDGSALIVWSNENTAS
jgi:hypothetical protein